MRNKVDNVNHRPADLADEVFEAIHTLMHLYRARQQRALQAGPQALTHMEYKVLGFFAHHPGATQSALVAHSGRDKAQLTRLIRGLRDAGLLDAQADEADRRSVHLQLTPAGKALHEAARRHGRQATVQAVKGLSQEECRQLVTLLQKLRTNLDAEAD